MLPLANLNMQTHYYAHIRFLLYLISPTHEWNRTFSNSEKVNSAKETWKASGNCTKQFNILYDYIKMKAIYATYHMVHRTHQHSPDVQSYYSNCVISMALAFLIHTHTHTHTGKKNFQKAYSSILLDGRHLRRQLLCGQLLWNESLYLYKRRQGVLCSKFSALELWIVPEKDQFQKPRKPLSVIKMQNS